jgi:phage terminase small subunit
MSATLTDRQERFVFEYLIDLNATAAAKRAGYSANCAKEQASDLMRKPAVRERIRIELSSLLADLRCNALELMKERMRAAFFRAHKLFGPGGRVLEMEEMDADTRDALFVSIVKKKSGPEVRMRQPNREKALTALERVHEKLERLSEAYYDKLERDERNGWGELGEEGEAAMPKPFVPPVLDLERVKMREAGKVAGLVPEVAPEVAPEVVREAARATAREPSREPSRENQAAVLARHAAEVGPEAGPEAQPETGSGARTVAENEAKDAAENAAKDAARVAAQAAAQEAASQAEAARQAKAAARAGQQARRQAAQAPVQDKIIEKSEVLLGSKGRKAPLLGKLAKWLPKKKEAEGKGTEEPKRPGRDPNLIWGGTPKPTPEPEMKPSLIEHLLRVKQGEFLAQARRNVQAIAPGEPRPPNPDPGYNPPWLRGGGRPRYAIGAGECSFDGYGED